MQFFIAGFVYTVIWNLVDFPAGVLRFGTETGAQIDSYDDQNEPMLKSARHVSREILFVTWRTIKLVRILTLKYLLISYNSGFVRVGWNAY